MYTNQEFGYELKKQLERNFDVVKIARWAENVYSNHCREISSELNDIIMVLAIMEHGKEFEYSKQELDLLAEKLILNEKNPFTRDGNQSN
jgi:hypothetical protein